MITDDRWPSTMLAMRVCARWLALDGRAKRLSLEAALLTALAVVRVTIEGAPRLLRAAVPPGSAPAGEDDLRDYTLAIARASRYVPGATCLPQALALTWMLTRRGIAAGVRLGVQTNAGVLSAHAWVECQGMRLNGPVVGDPFVTLR